MEPQIRNYLARKHRVFNQRQGSLNKQHYFSPEGKTKKYRTFDTVKCDDIRQALVFSVNLFGK